MTPTPLSGKFSISRIADDTCELTLTDTTSQIPVLTCTITSEDLITALMGAASRPCEYTVTPSAHWGEHLETQTVFLPAPEDSKTLDNPESFTMWLHASIQSYTQNGWQVTGPATFNHHDWDRTQGYRVHLSRYLAISTKTI